MLLSLAVASFTRSKVIAMVWIDAATEGRVSSSRLRGDNVGWGVLERMPARSGCPKGMTGGGSVFMVATSSEMGRASGLRGPVGCRDIASAALCLIPGMWIFESGSAGFSLSGCVAVR
jgi:hypothetical protein